ncbi:MAG: DUF3179 domain-containing protein [Anaerolineae bacterium]
MKDFSTSRPNCFKHHAPLHSFILFLIFFFSSLATACSSEAKLDQAKLLNDLLSADEQTHTAAFKTIVDSGDPVFLAPLIDLYWAGQVGLNDWSGSAETVAALEKLSGESLGDEWADWVTWYSRSSHGPPAGYTAWKGELFTGVDSDFGRFFEGMTAENFRVEEVVWGGVAKDGIPALDFIKQVPIAEAKGFTPKDAVFGLSINGDHRAYPLRIMDWHEMANDVVGGEAVSIAYCTLCGSAIAYKTTHPASEAPIDFGSSGLLYRSNKLMYDRQTNTLWNQLTGRPVMGPLVGQVDQLEILPLVITTIEAWQAQHPDATVVPLETGTFRDYTAGAAYGDYFVREELLFPVGEIDDRLPAKTQVFALQVDDAAGAYPVEAFGAEPVINDQLGGINVVLIAASSNINVYGYSYELEYITYSAGGEIRAFERGDHLFELTADGVLIDEDDRVWEIQEDQLIGPNQESLKRLGGHISFWFGWQSFYPETAVYRFE